MGSNWPDAFYISSNITGYLEQVLPNTVGDKCFRSEVHIGLSIL